MAGKKDKSKMITNEKLDELIHKFDQERELSVQEMHSTQMIVRQFTKTVDSSMGTLERTINTLATKIEKLADQQSAQSNQIVEILVRSESEKENNRIVSDNMLKTQEEIGSRVGEIARRTHTLETKVHTLELGSERSQKLDDRIRIAESFIDSHNGIQTEKKKTFDWWSRNWWKVLGLLIPISYAIVVVTEQIKNFKG